MDSKNALSYKGYHAKVEFDYDDMIIIGKVLGLQDSLYFHCKSADEVSDKFHECVDEYLDMCAAFGKTPEKEYKGSFNIRMSSEMHRAAAIEAEGTGITLNQFVVTAIQEKLSKNAEGSKYCTKLSLGFNHLSRTIPEERYSFATRTNYKDAPIKDTSIKFAM